MSSDSFDAVFVGSGINSLVGAALLAKSGWKVCVLERNSWFGGNIRSAEITEPGFMHNLYSAWHPLFTGSEACALLKPDLEMRGLEYLNTEYSTAALYPDGSSCFLSTSQDTNERNSAALGTLRGRFKLSVDYLPRQTKAQSDYFMWGTKSPSGPSLAARHETRNSGDRS